MTSPLQIRALRTLEEFQRRVLPSYLRRLAQWKGVDAQVHPDLVDDLLQDLYVDALESPDAVLELDERSRHARWLSRLQRSHYQLVAREDRLRDQEQEVLDLPGPHEVESPALDQLSGEERRLLQLVHERGGRLKNGRLSSTLTARAVGVSNRRLRQLWSRIAHLCGFDERYEDYWRSRLCEALLQATAGRLLESGALQVFDEELRTRFDAAACQQRMRRIRTALECRPLGVSLRSVLVTVAPRSGTPIAQLPIRSLLDLADRLSPADPRVDLWRFEASVAEGDLRAAGVALRRARSSGACPMRIGLARARLLECRHRRLGARRLLTRLAREFPRDPRPAESMREFDRHSDRHTDRHSAIRGEHRRKFASSHAQRTARVGDPKRCSSRSSNNRSSA